MNVDVAPPWQGSARFTLDTNVLVHCVDAVAGRRHETARQVIELAAAHGSCRLTLQAVSEFHAAATRKGLMQPADAAAQGADWLELLPSPIPASTGAVRAALLVAATGRLSYWDALLLATAAEGGCEAILTEDMASGALVEGIRVINPFDTDGDLSPAARDVLRVRGQPFLSGSPLTARSRG